MKSADIQKRILEILSDNEEHYVQEMKEILNTEFGKEDYSEGQFAGSLNTLTRNGAISKIGRGVYTLKGEQVLRKCFVVSAIGDEDSDIRKDSEQVYKYIIQPVCDEMDFSPVRVDKINDADTITQTIIENLLSADLVIADITHHNPNAFFEMGYRSAVGKPILYLRRTGVKIPFDIAGVRVFEYNLNDLDSVDVIKDRLRKTIEAISFDSSDSTQSRNSGFDLSPLLSTMYEIKDEIAGLKQVINNQYNDTLKTIISSFPQAQPEDPQTALMKVILPELLKNPSSIKTLMEISKYNMNGES